MTLLAGTLAGLRDRLAQDGFHSAAELVQDLVEIADDYLGDLDRAPRDEGLPDITV